MGEGFAMLLRSVLCCLALIAGLTSVSRGQTPLQEQLTGEGAASLAKAARAEGDARRGAILFHQPFLACAKCHSVGQTASQTVNASNLISLGPDLTKPDKTVTAESIVESVLEPSKVIKQGFEPVVVQTTDGKTVTGLLVEETPDKLVLRDVGQGGAVVTLSKSQIDEHVMSKTSIMPAGQVNALGSRQQFLDLARYLIEIAEGGPERAKQLQPPASLFAFVLPEYEKQIDHAGMLSSLDEKSFQRGEAIYNRLCINCHGTKDQPGSLPTSLKFADGKFKNGADPWRMYQTLTHGFNLMAAQTWMVPQQKYDVIHYVRETYLKPHNATQYVQLDETYLASLPKGTTRGPAPSNVDPWSSMNYGPYLAATYEVGSDGKNFAHKGIAVRLDPGPGGVSRGKHWMVFDHDTLRVAAAWSRVEEEGETRSGGEREKETANPRGNSLSPPLRVSPTPTPTFIDWHGINFDGRHQIHPRVSGEVAFANQSGPGWANPATGRFDEERVLGRDGRRYGPLPRAWGRYRGLYQYGDNVVLSYTVGETNVLEMPGVLNGQTPRFTRTFHIGPRSRPMLLKVRDRADGSSPVRVAGLPGDIGWQQGDDGSQRLSLPAGAEPLKFVISLSPSARAESDDRDPAHDILVVDLVALTKGGPRRWPEVLTTDVVVGPDSGPFAVDVLSPPVNNPWLALTRLTGFDFFDDGDRAAVCSWDGDVWLVSGLRGNPDGTKRIDGSDMNHGNHETSKSKAASGDSSHQSHASPKSHSSLTWQRIATGLFQPLGLKIVDGQIYVTCRDQLAILRDLNGDNEADFIECFNSDHQVTEHFHEFAMGLQTDEAGNFYYAKSARHALTAVVPHHGTLLRVSKDGSRTDILANGFRAANGVCLNPDGTFVVTDQEGHWNPKNRINWVTPAKEGERPHFYGNMFGYHDVTDSSDSAMIPPLCWITNAFDRSPAELLWVTSDKWGPLKGSLLNLSYGYGKVFVVPHETVARAASLSSSSDKADGTASDKKSGTGWQPVLRQGGLCELPIPQFPTGIMRGRFHPTDGQLYVCGMFAWAGNATQPGGFYRIRATGRPAHAPIGLTANQRGLSITFTEPLDPASATDVSKYVVQTWSLKRTADYGSKHFDEQTLKVANAKLSADRRTVQLDLPDIQPTWCMSIEYKLTGSKGEPVNGLIHNTIHSLGE